MNINYYNFIPSNIIGYWLSKNFAYCFEKSNKLSFYCEPKKGLDTGDNDRFLRLWYEIKTNDVFFNSTDNIQAMYSGRKWFPITKGGTYRKWYGNNEYVVNYKNNGYELVHFEKSNIRNTNYYFFESLTWTDFTSGNISFRYNHNGFIHNVAGPCIFELNKNLSFIFAFLNSNVANEILKFLSPTVHYNVGTIAELPIILFENINVDNIVKENVKISKYDWDSFEVSWDFKKHPLI